MDVSNLTPRQRANVAGLQLKRDAIRRKYGNSVQIITTDEEAANASGWMALPLSLINTNKQLTLRMDKQVVDTIKSQKLGEISRESMPDTIYVEDVVTALESNVRGYTPKSVSKPTEAEVKAPAITVKAKPAKSVESAVSDADFIKNLLGK